MRPKSIVMCLVCLCAVVWADSAWSKSFVYKASITANQLHDGTKTVLNGYFVVGDLRPVTGGIDDYRFASTQVVVVGGIAGKKKFLRFSDGQYRAARVAKVINSKTRTVVIFLQESALQMTTDDTGPEGASFLAKLLSGLVTDDHYELPMKVTGDGLSSVSSPSAGRGTHTRYKLSLVRDLTDASPADETLQQAGDRLAAFLASKGLSDATP
jgi:hypothetical protein